MKIKVYIRIEGETFRPDAFANGVGSKFNGRVGRRAHDGSPLTRRPMEYWESRVIIAGEQNAESALAELLRELVSVVEPLAHSSDVSVWAEMIAYCSSDEKLAGFFFPRETLRLLSKIGAQLEICQQPM
jgi:hypothetical protein